MPMEITDTMSAQEVESKLWTDYLVMLARKHTSWRLRKEAFRRWVMTHNTNPTASTVLHKCTELYDMWSQREKEAYVAWQQVAYPMGGLRLKSDGE